MEEPAVPTLPQLPCPAAQPLVLPAHAASQQSASRGAAALTSPEDSLGGEEGEGVAQVEAHAGPKLGERAGACAVASQDAVAHHILNHFEVLQQYRKRYNVA